MSRDPAWVYRLRCAQRARAQGSPVLSDPTCFSVRSDDSTGGLRRVDEAHVHLVESSAWVPHVVLRLVRRVVVDSQIQAMDLESQREADVRDHHFAGAVVGRVAEHGAQFVRVRNGDVSVVDRVVHADLDLRCGVVVARQQISVQVHVRSRRLRHEQGQARSDHEQPKRVEYMHTLLPPPHKMSPLQEWAAPLRRRFVVHILNQKNKPTSIGLFFADAGDKIRDYPFKQKSPNENSEIYGKGWWKKLRLFAIICINIFFIAMQTHIFNPVV